MIGKQIPILHVCALLLAMLTSGCGQSPVAKFGGIDEVDYTKWETGSHGGEIAISVKTVTANDTATSDILDRVFCAVVDRDLLTLEWAPCLAERWEISKDGLSADFYMRKDLRWSDGEPLTCEDVVWSVNNVYLNDKILAGIRDLFYVGDEPAKFEKTGDDAFRITTKVVYADILSLANFQPVPKHILAPLIAEKGSQAINSFWGTDTDVKRIVGSGPFVVSEYKANQRIVLAKNPNYWRKDSSGKSLPYLDRINLVVVEDQDTASLRLLAGELDATDRVRGENVASLLGKNGKSKIRLYNAGPEAASNFIAFNENKKVPHPRQGWFNNKKFREAMSMLVDRVTIIDNVYFGFAYPQYSFVPRLSPYYWDGADRSAPGFDPLQAKKILDSLDLKDRDKDGIREDALGNDVTFTIETNADSNQRVRIAEILSAEMRNAGVNAVFKPADLNTIIAKLTATFEWDAIVIGLSGSVEPFLGWSNVIPSYGNLHLTDPNQATPAREWEKITDKLYAENTTIIDNTRRKQTGDEIQRIWLEEQPWIYTVNEAGIYAFSERLGNVKPRSVDPYAGWKGIAEYLYVK
jgi:peptide/nickel transport system substrate-binding protein